MRPDPSIPSVTSSAVEDAENPDGPFLLNHHISLSLPDSPTLFCFNTKRKKRRPRQAQILKAAHKKARPK